MRMPVPPISAIRRGVPVSIVLKQDQRTGKRTTGHVADILTRGDHPRGVKVRLSSGLIGRVQSLVQADQADMSSYQAGNSQAPYQNSNPPQYAQVTGAYRPQQGHENAPPMPSRPAARTLQDFVPQEEHGEQIEYMQTFENNRAPTTEEIDREELGKQFPKVDGSLVAAIYGDCGGDMSACREMLQALSEE